MKAKTFLGIILFFIFILSATLYSQSNLQGWNVYTCMKEVKDISIFQNNVYVATTGGLFSFNYNSPQTTIKKYTTIEGLLNNELHSVTADNNGNVWSGGVDGSINFFNPSANSWHDIPDIQTSSETSKGINGIFQYGRYMFFATDFSVIKFDVNTQQFVDQPYIYLGQLLAVKTPVNKVYVVNDTVWAATKNGIAFANINNYLPIQSNWKDFTNANSPLINNQTNSIAYFDGKVFFATDSGIFYYNNNVLNPFSPVYNGSIVNGPILNLTVAGNSLYFTTYKSSNNTFRVDLPNISNAQLVFTGVNINTIKPGYNGDLLIGTVRNGVNIYKNGTNNYVLPNGPNSNLDFNIAIDGKSNLWEVSGAPGDGSSSVYKYNGTAWKNYLNSDYPALGTNCCGWIYAFAASDGTIWVGGFGKGLLKISGEIFFRYTDTNSILMYAHGFQSGFDQVSGIDMDQNGKLWVLNNTVDSPIVNFTDSKKYLCPGGNCNSVFYSFLAIDNYNTKWMTLHNSLSGVTGVDYFNESANTGLHMEELSQFGSDISQINHVVKEKNGEIWIATNNGIFIISDPSQVISNPNTPPAMFKMRIIENGLSTPLLENVSCIGVDAVNNKWLGTASHGLLYVSSDGSTLLNRLTHSNSGLIDDRITFLISDKGTGKLYVATPSGLCSFQTVAVQPLSDCDKITAGPNPFIIPNNNLLRISGLVENSSVKILTISGKLVIDFPSPGGKIANWDGRDVNGNLVASGIYIIAGYNQDGSKVCTGKVAVIKR
jgi:ligand-binding sensor domain-containing protein